LHLSINAQVKDKITPFPHDVETESDALPSGVLLVENVTHEKFLITFTPAKVQETYSKSNFEKILLISDCFQISFFINLVGSH
jgi:hypothetical protein